MCAVVLLLFSMQIMLGLTTHEPHFSLLREEVRFTGRNSQKRSTAPEETTFHLLHLSLMREYLEFEFGGELRVKMPFLIFNLIFSLFNLIRIAHLITFLGTHPLLYQFFFFPISILFFFSLTDSATSSFHPPPGSVVEYYDEHVCVSVCPHMFR